MDIKKINIAFIFCLIFSFGSHADILNDLLSSNDHTRISAQNDLKKMGYKKIENIFCRLLLNDNNDINHNYILQIANKIDAVSILLLLDEREINRCCPQIEPTKLTQNKAERILIELDSLSVPGIINILNANSLDFGDDLQKAKYASILKQIGKTALSAIPSLKVVLSQQDENKWHINYQYRKQIYDSIQSAIEVIETNNGINSSIVKSAPSESKTDGIIGFSVSAAAFNGLCGPIIVKKVFPNSPACMAGILENDSIVEIENSKLYGKRFEDIIANLKGPVGSKVNISVKRPPFSKEVVIALERAKSNGDNGYSCNDSLASRSLNEKFANSSALSDFSIAAQSIDPVLLKEYIARYSRINNNSSIFCLDSARSLLNKKEREWLKLSLYSKKHPTFFDKIDNTTFKTGYNNSSSNEDNLFNFQVSIKGLKPEIESVFRFYLDTLINDFKSQRVKLRFPASILIDYSKKQPVIQLTSHINVALDIDIFKYLQTSKKMFQIMGGVYAANIMHQYKRKVMQKFTYYLQSKNATQFEYQEYLNKIKSALYVIIMYKNNNEYIVQYADNPRFLDNQNYG